MDGTSFPATRSADSTSTLLERARAGDQAAIDALFARCLPPLLRWARGRLPQWARDLADTQDVVQEAVLQTFRHLGTFEARGEGALQAYLRQAVLNRIRDHIRRVGRRPVATELDSHHEDEGPSPLEQAVGAQAIDRYEAALQRLSDADRELIVASVELGYSYEQLAEATGRASPDASYLIAHCRLVNVDLFQLESGASVNCPGVFRFQAPSGAWYRFAFNPENYPVDPLRLTCSSTAPRDAAGCKVWTVTPSATTVRLPDPNPKNRNRLLEIDESGTQMLADLGDYYLSFFITVAR